MTRNNWFVKIEDEFDDQLGLDKPEKHVDYGRHIRPSAAEELTAQEHRHDVARLLRRDFNR